MKATKPQVKLASYQDKLLSYRAKREEKNTHSCIAINSVTIVSPKKIEVQKPPPSPTPWFWWPNLIYSSIPFSKKIWLRSKILYLANIGRARTHILQDVCVRASFMGLEKLELLEVYLGTESKNQNGNLRWHLPWRRGGSRGGLECHIPILKNDFF